MCERWSNVELRSVRAITQEESREDQVSGYDALPLEEFYALAVIISALMGYMEQVTMTPMTLSLSS